MVNSSTRQKIDPYIYYIIIGLVSFATLTIMPLIGTDLEAALVYPTTIAGWIVFVVTKLCISVINVILFYSFVQQGKCNVIKDKNENYIKANNIMDEISSKVKRDKKYIPKSPETYLKKTYFKKGTSIFISSLLGSFAFTQAVLAYDYKTLISYSITLFFGFIFGVLQMKKTEFYWTEEYLEYAKMIKKELEIKEASDGFRI